MRTAARMPSGRTTRCWMAVHGCVTLGVSAEIALAKVREQLALHTAGGNGGPLKLPPAVTRSAALQAAAHGNGDEPRPLRPALSVYSDNAEDQAHATASIPADSEPVHKASHRQAEISLHSTESRQQEKSSGAQAMPDDVVLL